MQPPLPSESIRFIRHQLKGPVTVIHGYLSFWKTDAYKKFSPEKQREFILKAFEATENLDKMINELSV